VGRAASYNTGAVPQESPDRPVRPSAFPVTRHSVIERMRDPQPVVRRDAFADLVAGYWKPVYKHLRLTWQLSLEDAQDLTQTFFAEAFEKAWLERFDPAKARFRTFVRVCADRVVMNWKQAAGRMKRGGGAEVVPLDFEAAERELGLRVAAPPDAEELFRQEFVRSLFARAVDLVRDEYRRSGRDVHLRLFERYDLDPDEGVGYADLARELGLTTTQVTNYLAQVRRAFRQHALETLRALTGSDQDFRDEARDLFGIDVP
jgi:DNA-directed RNA polymerase specialized sigma24 family protein